MYAMVLPKVLIDLYEDNQAIGPDGVPIPCKSQVVREFAEALHQVVLERRPEVVLEVGMAYGATTMAAAAACEENGTGRVISIDPFQSTDWLGLGVLNVERAGLSHRVQLVEDFDYLALPRLLEQSTVVDVAYIDGLHSYEYALLDFFYVDKMLRPGGLVGFNDSDWPAVLPTFRFLEHHREYRRIDVGLPPMYAERNEAMRQLTRVERKVLPGDVRPSKWRPVAATIGRRRDDRYYEKVEAWEPPEGFMPPRWR